MTQNAKDIFVAAIEKYSPEHWPSYLDGVCGEDTELRARVDDLLAAHQKSDAFLDQPAATIADEFNIAEGTEIGLFKLLQKIGEGGFGVVFMAEQAKPVRRKVALKIIKPGMDSKEVIARFEAERQALAMMDHPNIAKVLDAGTTDKGLPYFAMELVKGVTITEYADTNHLSTSDRLRLLTSVARAVHHAHQKGVIHRDLKPSNVLVTLHDGKPVPKVIDFGVSKAVSQPLTEQTLFTRFGQVIGTPQYMSPEQAEMSGLDVDTRSDVYSLGVILYELLTGRTPFLSEEIRRAGFDEMRRMIREKDPVRPSNILQTLDEDTATSVASNRSIRPEALQRLVRGELDWIVMRALEKDRNRRYDSANSFADDIERHLNDEAVEANPPSLAYRFWKSYRRNRVGFVAAGAIAASLIVGLGASLIFANIARNESAANERSKQIAQSEREKAEAAATLAKAEAGTAEKTLNVLISILSMTTTNPSTGDEYTVREALSGLAELELNSKSKNKLKTRFGDLELPTAVVGQLNLNLGKTLLDQLEFYRAAKHFEAAAAAACEINGSESVSHSRCLRMWGIASGDESKLLKAIAIERKLQATSDLTKSLTQLGRLRIECGSTRQSIEPLIEAARAFEIEPRTSFQDLPHPFLASAYESLDETLQASAYQRQATDLAQRIPLLMNRTRNAWLNLGKRLRIQNLYEHSETALLIAAKLEEDTRYEPEYYLANNYAELGKPSAAKALLKKCLKLEPPTDWKQSILGKLADICLSAGEYEEALDHLWATFDNQGTESLHALSKILVISGDNENVRKRLLAVEQSLSQKNTNSESASKHGLTASLMQKVLSEQKNVDRLVKLMQKAQLVPEGIWPAAYRAARFESMPVVFETEATLATQVSPSEECWSAVRHARAYYRLKDFEQAERLLLEAMANADEFSPDDDFLKAHLFHEIACFMVMAGKSTSSRELFGKMESVFRNRPKGKGHIYDALQDVIMLWDGNIQSNREHPSTSLETNLLSFLRKSKTTRHRFSSHKALAGFYLRVNKFDSALDHLEKVSQLLPELPPVLPMDYVDEQLAELYKKTRQIDRGLLHFENLLRSYDLTLVSEHPQRAFLRMNYAALLLNSHGNEKRALQAIREAQRVLRLHHRIPKKVLDKLDELEELALNSSV